MSQDSKRPTLGEFIESNHRLFTVLGVFSALVLFASALPFKPLAHALAFIYLVLSILIWFEIVRRYPATGARWNLWVFGNLVTISVLVLLLYSLVEYRAAWRALLVLPVFAIVLLVVLTLFERWRVFDRAAGIGATRPKWIRYLLGPGLRWGLVYLLLLFSYLIANPINTLLDRARHSLLDSAEAVGEREKTGP